MQSPVLVKRAQGSGLIRARHPAFWTIPTDLPQNRTSTGGVASIRGALRSQENGFVLLNLRLQSFPFLLPLCCLIACKCDSSISHRFSLLLQLLLAVRRIVQPMSNIDLSDPAVWAERLALWDKARIMYRYINGFSMGFFVFTSVAFIYRAGIDPNLKQVLCLVFRMLNIAKSLIDWLTHRDRSSSLSSAALPISLFHVACCSSPAYNGCHVG